MLAFKAEEPITESLAVNGFCRLSTVDYPHELSAVVFCQGCPWRCRYCHNPDLLETQRRGDIPWQKVMQHLHQRKGLLDAVVFSGGEPLLQSALYDAMFEVKALGYKVGLHTSGGVPTMLERVLPLIDWIGLDVKCLPENYPALTGVEASGRRFLQSFEIVKKASCAVEYRTTVHWDLLSRDELRELALWLSGEGVKKFVVQMCRTQRNVDVYLRPNVRRPEEEEVLWQEMGELFDHFELRDA